MKKKLIELFKLDAIPCDEACIWAEKNTFSDSIDMVISAKCEWRQWVALHSSDKDTLQTLAADQSWGVRFAVARNANTPV